MVAWTCPHCGKNFYSANTDMDKPEIECIYCHKAVENPYYRGVK